MTLKLVSKVKFKVTIINLVQDFIFTIDNIDKAT